MFSHLKLGDIVKVVSPDNASIEVITHVSKYHIRVSDRVMKYRRRDGSSVSPSVRHLELVGTL